jgi:hypothetical protein
MAARRENDVHEFMAKPFQLAGFNYPGRLTDSYGFNKVLVKLSNIFWPGQMVATE